MPNLRIRSTKQSAYIDIAKARAQRLSWPAVLGCIFAVCLLGFSWPVALGQTPAPRVRPNTAVHLQKWFQNIQRKVKKLQKAIAKAGPKERFGLLMKLAGEFEEIVRIHVLLVKRYDTYQSSAMWQKLAPLRQEANKQAALFRIQTAQIYQMLLGQYPDDPRLCKVYHGLAKHLLALQQTKLAVQIYQGLLKTFQGKVCAHKADAYLLFGEQQFTKGAFPAAISLYQKVLAEGQSTNKPFALYKLGWCFYNLQQFTKALGHFVQAIEGLQKTPDAQRPPNAQKLRKMARKDLVLVYSHIGNPKSAAILFRKVEPLHAQDMLHLLANVFKTQGKFAYAAEMFQGFVKEAGAAPVALDYLYQLLQISQQYSPEATLLRRARELQRLIPELRAHQQKPSYQKIAQKLHILLFTLGMRRHHKIKQYKQALAWYDLAALMLQPKQGGGLWFWRGEAHMGLRQFARAARDYERYHKRTIRGKHAKDAAFNAVLAHDRALQAAGHKGRRPWKPGEPRKDSPSIHISALYRASHTFLRLYPKDSRAAAVRYRYLYYAHRFDNIPLTLRLFKQMMQRQPRHPYNAAAAQLVVALLHRHRRDDLLHWWSTWLQAQYPQTQASARFQALMAKGTTQPTSAPATRPTSRPAARPASRSAR